MPGTRLSGNAGEYGRSVHVIRSIAFYVVSLRRTGIARLSPPIITHRVGTAPEARSTLPQYLFFPP